MWQIQLYEHIYHLMLLKLLYMDENYIVLMFDDSAYFLIIYYSYLYILNDIVKHNLKKL